MRVLLYHSGASWSATARVLDAVARGLVARDWEVTMACREGSAMEEHVVDRGYDVVPLPMEGHWMGRSWRLRSVLRERFVEVVVVHGDVEHLVAANAMRMADRGAVVRRVRPGERHAPGVRGRMAARLATTDVLFSTPQDVRPVRGAASEPLIAEVGVAADGYAGVRPAARANLGVDDDARLVACVYDRDSRGAAAAILRAARQLAERHPDLRVVLLGPGSDDEELRMHAAALGLTRVVVHLGERDDHLAVLRASDLVWVAACADDAAYGFLDAMALGLPVVAERGALAAHYVADGITGLLLVPGDTSAASARIAWLIGHPEERARMGEAGRVRVARDFAESAMVEAFEAAASAARDRTRWRL